VKKAIAVFIFTSGWAFWSGRRRVMEHRHRRLEDLVEQRHVHK